MLKVENINLYYGASQVLKSVSMSAMKGQVTCVLGRNGVGKSSLMRGVVGQTPIRDGAIMWEDKDISRMGAADRARAGIAVVPQGREIFPLLTVEENLKTGFGMLPRSDRTIPEEVFTLFPVLKDMLGRRGGDLSGGQQQQLCHWQGAGDATHGCLPWMSRRKEYSHRSSNRSARRLRRLQNAVIWRSYWSNSISISQRSWRISSSSWIEAKSLCLEPPATWTKPMFDAVSASDSALQRSHGEARLRFAADATGQSRLKERYASSPARLLTPRTHGEAPEAVLANTAGGVAGGDSLSVSVECGPGADGVVSGQAAEKIYRALDAPAKMQTKLRLDAGATLEWLPQETILFNGALLNRQINVDLADDARLLMAETIVLGRKAHNETFASGWPHRLLADRSRRSALMARPDVGRRRR